MTVIVLKIDLNGEMKETLLHPYLDVMNNVLLSHPLVQNTRWIRLKFQG